MCTENSSLRPISAVVTSIEASQVYIDLNGYVKGR